MKKYKKCPICKKYKPINRFYFANEKPLAYCKKCDMGRRRGKIIRQTRKYLYSKQISINGRVLKKCTTCLRFKPIRCFRRGEFKRRSTCNACLRRYMIGWRSKNHKHIRKYANRYNRERSRSIRLEVLRVYGGKCRCCGEKHVEFLAIDHIKKNGYKHRKMNPGLNIYTWLKQRGFPKRDFRILCHNCNCSLGFYGYCPHKRRK